MNTRQMNTRQKYELMMDLYADLKHEMRQETPHEYERWKAGGFLVDDDILSMYPHLGKLIDKIEPEGDEDEDEDSDENN